MRDRASHIICNARNLGAAPFIRPDDICSGNKKLNMSFVAQLFNSCPKLYVPPEIDIAQYDFASLEIDDLGDSREERTSRMWINSLNLEGLYVNNLFTSLSDGVGILKLLDLIQPGLVVWKRVNLESKSVFKRVENANYCVSLCRDLKLSLVNIGGLDITNGSRKIILSIIGQLIRIHTLQVIKRLAHDQGIKEISDEQILQWANRKVADSGHTDFMRNFKDSTLATGIFFLRLASAIEPRATNWELVTAGESKDEKLSNAKYVISVARKIGACVFLAPEDIVDIQSKQLVTFVASLWAADLYLHQSGSTSSSSGTSSSGSMEVKG